MAQEHIINDQMSVISLSKMDIVNLITLLSAQLADVCAPGRQGGACPEIVINDKGRQRRVSFCLEPDNKTENA
jgi:hypothetical protein